MLGLICLLGKKVLTEKFLNYEKNPKMLRANNGLIRLPKIEVENDKIVSMTDLRVVNSDRPRIRCFMLYRKIINRLMKFLFG